MTNNIVYLKDYSAPTITENVVNSILTSVVADYNAVLQKYNVDVEDVNTAFDIATIQFLLRGMAHRTQGEEHPSQAILNSMRVNMLGK
jgi:hypothetical protein